MAHVSVRVAIKHMPGNTSQVPIAMYIAAGAGMALDPYPSLYRSWLCRTHCVGMGMDRSFPHCTRGDLVIVRGPVRMHYASATQ